MSYMNMSMENYLHFLKHKYKVFQITTYKEMF